MNEQTGISERPTARERGAEAWIALGYVVAFVAVYALTAWPHRLPLDAGPWNPAHALSLALLMICGPRHTVTVLIANLAAYLLMFGAAAEWWVYAGMALAVAGGYGAAAKVLRDEVDFDSRLSRLRDVMVLVVVVVAAAMAVAAAEIAVAAMFRLVPWDFFTQVVFRAWASHVIGILSVAPVLLVRRRLRGRDLLQPEAAVFLALIGLTTWLLFGPLFDAALRAFYLLFLPLVWISVRHGLRGAALGVVTVHLALMVATAFGRSGGMTLTDLQLLMLALTVTNLVLGGVVSERRRAEVWLRAHQAELAHASRLSTSGEMASALAHELNQPLAATISYVRACQMAMQRGPADPELLGLMDKAVAQAERAAAVVRGLRSFLRKEDAPRTLVEPRVLIAEALALSGSEAAHHQVALRSHLIEPLPRVRVDAIQIQQVIINLVRNGIEAVSAAEARRRQVTVTARAVEGGLEVSVADTGAGLSPEIADRLFAPFTTTKRHGMGLGLAIARSIVETHGGRLWADKPQPRGGAVFRFRLPDATKEDQNGR